TPLHAHPGRRILVATEKRVQRLAANIELPVWRLRIHSVFGVAVRRHARIAGGPALGDSLHQRTKLRDREARGCVSGVSHCGIPRYVTSIQPEKKGSPSEESIHRSQRACDMGPSRDILKVRGDRAGRSPLAGEEYPMGDLLWPLVIVSFVG